VDSAGAAATILDRLKAGDDFAVLARQKSVDATAIDGGFMGDVDPNTLRSELRDALRGMQPGQLSPIVELPSGYAILKALPHAELAERERVNQNRLAAVNAAGSVRYVTDVSGLMEAEGAFANVAMPDGWRQDLGLICETYTQALPPVVDSLHNLLSPTSEKSLLRDQEAKPIDVMGAHMALGQLYAHKAEMEKAIEQLEAAHRVALLHVSGAVPLIEEMLGISYLHKSEIENDVYRHPGDKCLFPMQPAARYAQTASSEKAIQHFLKYSALKPNDLEVKWLLNLAYMTIGSYPAGVPPESLLPPTSFASSEDIGRFTDVAPEAGLNLFGMAAGVIVDDFDNDGLLDVVVSSFDNCQPLRFFHNNGDGSFTDRAREAGLLNQLGGLNILQTDYNNDGCLDILVLRGGWQFAHRKSLLRNNCDGTFTDVTAQSGLAEPATSTQTAAWADINNDGFLDLFVGNENEPSQLFVNKGDGTFEDVSRSAGVNQVASTKGVTAADYDNDGYVDFYVSNFNRFNFLYHNNQDGTFTEIAEQAGVPGTGRGFATWFFDYDNDGWSDLFVTSYFPSVDETVRTYLGLTHNAGTLKLYKNLGNGAFRDVTKEAKLDVVFMPMGANFGDVDNDGYPDIYLGTGNPSYGSVLPNVLLRNNEGEYFVDITASSGTGELHKGHGIGFADIDHDGDEDILTSIGGATPGDSHAFRLFENPGHGNDWISLRLVGVKSNRAAIGARIKVTVNNEGHGARSIYRTVGSGGSFGASPLQQHIGLGKSAQIVSVEVWWPGGDKTPFTLSNVDKNQFLEIKESTEGYTKLDRRSYLLGGANGNASIDPKEPLNDSQEGQQAVDEVRRTSQ
jgi:tetratricopeptide (TPR) repeat protein